MSGVENRAKILAINPGSTSTKFAIYEGHEAVFEDTLRHPSVDIAKFAKVVDQLDWRMELIVEGLKSHNVEIADLDAVVGRGGLVKPIKGGVYEVNGALYHDSKEAEHEHASNLGALIAKGIADKIGVKAYIADPVVVDELDDVARISGHPAFPRTSAFHALNSKAIAKRHAKSVGKRYEDMNLIVAHMGGGISVSVHKKGRVVDTTNALSGAGSFSPERAGRVEPLTLVEVCFSGKYTQEEISKMLIGKGGLVAHLGYNSMYDAVCAANDGDAKAKSVVDAFCYNVAKDVGAMSTVLCGEVDAILITGGIAFSEFIVKWITERVQWISEVVPYPGEDELGALVSGVIDVMEGETEVQTYI
ncbi:MAG: butyrate kinase [Rikenellaceae bacterium]